MVTPKINEAEFREIDNRVKSGADLREAPAKPNFDIKQHKEFSAEHRGKRSIEDYRQVLEHWNFSFLNDVQLMEEGLSPTGSGRWTNWKSQDSFSNDDILSMFPTPQEFHEWFSKEIAKRRLARDVSQGKVDPRQRSKILTRL